MTPPPKRIDLSDADVVDDHCHGFRLDEILARDPRGFEARCTLLGMGVMSSAQALDDPRDRAFERLYELYVREVYRYVLAVLRNPSEAEDVTQATFLNLSLIHI